jgi:hypothetical protein
MQDPRLVPPGARASCHAPRHALDSTPERRDPVQFDIEIVEEKATLFHHSSL